MHSARNCVKGIMSFYMLSVLTALAAVRSFCFLTLRLLCSRYTPRNPIVNSQSSELALSDGLELSTKPLKQALYLQVCSMLLQEGL